MEQNSSSGPTKSRSLSVVPQQTDPSKSGRRPQFSVHVDPELRKRRIYLFGRSPIEWLQLIVYYLLLYCLFILMFYIMYFCVFRASTNTKYPKLQGADSALGYTNLLTPAVSYGPGLGYRPKSVIAASSSLVFLEGHSVQAHIDQLGAIWDNYTIEKQPNSTDCFKTPPTDDTFYNTGMCTFINDLWKPCSKDTQFGYSSTTDAEIITPCMFIKLNQIYGWKPEFWSGDDDPGIPTGLRQYLTANNMKYSPDHIYIVCTPANPEDSESVSQITTYPPDGIHKIYFPFKNPTENIADYRPPMVAIRLFNLQPNVIATIRCQAYAKNVQINQEYLIGSNEMSMMWRT